MQINLQSKKKIDSCMCRFPTKCLNVQYLRWVLIWSYFYIYKCQGKGKKMKAVVPKCTQCELSMWLGKLGLHHRRYFDIAGGY